VLGGVELPEAAGHPRDGQAVAQGDVPVAKEPERPGSDPRHAAVLGDHGQGERLTAHRPRLTDPCEEAEVLDAAAESDVLAVVGRRVGVALALRQGLHGASERRPGLEDGDVVARVGQLERRGEPREAAADHDGSHSAATARTLPTAESCGRRVKTS
jgi:hypothetical protein